MIRCGGIVSTTTNEKASICTIFAAPVVMTGQKTAWTRRTMVVSIEKLTREERERLEFQVSRFYAAQEDDAADALTKALAIVDAYEKLKEENERLKDMIREAIGELNALHKQRGYCSFCGVRLDLGRKHKQDCFISQARGEVSGDD